MDLYNHHSYGQCDVAAPNFRSVAQVGTKAPEFVLTDLEGRRVSLTDLYEKYRSKGFELFIVYVREAHPGEKFPHHTSLEQKLAHARKLRDLEKVRLPILVDDLQGTTHKAYGLLPNMAYLIDREGTVVYKSDWTDGVELDGMCEALMRLDEMKAQGVPIIRQGISEGLHWIPMEPALRERVYRRSGEKAIKDYFNAKGHLPYATDAEKARPGPS